MFLIHKIYTYLEDYKKNPNDATPYLVITMFDELNPKKGKKNLPRC